MPEAWELGPSSYTPDDVTVQFRIRNVLILPEYRGHNNVVHRVNFAMLASLADYNQETTHIIDLDINNIEDFVVVENITEQQLTDWVIDRFLGPNGLLHAKQSCLQLYNESLRDQSAQFYPFSFLNSEPFIPPRGPVIPPPPNVEDNGSQ